MAGPRYDPDWEPEPFEGYWAPDEPDDASVGGPAIEKEALSITHDLTDAELRRFVGFDALYDPMPLLEFIPQWTLIVLLTAPVGFLLVFGSPHRPPLAVALAGAVLMPTVIVLILGRITGVRRRKARELGLCTGRVVTASPRGLSVHIPAAGKASTIRVGSGTHWVGPALWPWSTIRKITVDDRDLTFWTHPMGQDLEGRGRVVVPLRAFDGAWAAADFEQAARRWHAIASGQDAEWWDDDPA